MKTTKHNKRSNVNPLIALGYIRLLAAIKKAK